MSAPQAGRQSPEPETQSGAQVKETPAGSGKTSDDGRVNQHDSTKNREGGGDGQKTGLSSNPTHPLEEEAEKKTAKKE